jgi:hypothetical protein
LADAIPRLRIADEVHANLGKVVTSFAKKSPTVAEAMTTSDLPIAINREELAALCRARGVRKLSLFGSVLRNDFNPTRSDVDVLVE